MKPTTNLIPESPKLVRAPRIDEQSPITLAPDPAYEDQLAAFVDRWKEPARKTYKGVKLPPENQFVDANKKAAASQQVRDHPEPSPQKLPPIEQAAMVRVWVCDSAGCRWEYRPTAQAPTKSVQPQTYQRSRFRLLPRRR